MICNSCGEEKHDEYIVLNETNYYNGDVIKLMTLRFLKNISSVKQIIELILINV